MKFSALSLFAIFGVAAAGRPQLSVTVSDGSFGGIDGLDPTINWSGSSSTGDVDLEYGIDVAAKPTTDVATLPKKIWGKASTKIGGWTTSASADVEGIDFKGATYEIDADSGDMSVSLTASAAGVHKVEASKGFDVSGGSLKLNPRYNVDTEEADVVVSYGQDDTSVELTASTSAQSVKIGHKFGDTGVEVDASMDEQSLTVTQKLDDDNTITPTLKSTGEISVAWERSLGDGNLLTTTVRPNDSVDLEWKDDNWTANINFPVDGTSVTGANVSVKRDVIF